tara:strand:- start:462 stop:2282 length:1821 start_codon:yes stop_codon:yes gene_type:complete
MKKIFFLIFFILFSSKIFAEVNISHAIAMHGNPKYDKNFNHVDYVNPEAPKVGKVTLDAFGSFDSFNGFISKGEPAAGLSYIYETLTVRSYDEAFTEYGLIAETIEWPDDRSWVAFKLRKEAKWHDGKQITPEDVIWTFNTLIEKGHPFYKYYYGDVLDVIKEGDLRVRFNFKNNKNLELPLIVGQLPVLPKHYWENKNFEETTLEVPIGSGPYKIISFDAGRSITYELNDDYWGKNIPINKGKNNFKKINFQYFKDREIVRLALKSGDIDIFNENQSKAWATAYKIPAVENGVLRKDLIDHENPQGMQAFAFNIRKKKFEKIKVRKAISLAFDFEWTNQNLFYGAYKRTNSFFENSELASSGLPSEEELKILNKFKKSIPLELYNKEFNPPVTDGSGFIRKELSNAISLLNEEGWELINGKLTNSLSGEEFKFEILLVSPAFERIVLPFKDNLQKLGISVNVRIVDSAQYQERLNTFDFDMIVATFGQSLSPGNEQRNYWGSDAADNNGSRNVIGIKNKVIDSLIENLISAKDRKDLITATKALDRVLLWNHYVIPQWHISSYRTLYWDIFDKPKIRPKYSLGIDTWWIDESKAKSIEDRKKSIQ